jgi:site-specific DNA recombinase
MIAAVYCRKSTAENGVAEDQKSVARQLDQARGFAAAKGWTIDEDAVFVDDGISGAEHERRPGFVALLGAVERGPSFDVLLVADLTRLSRDNRKLDKYVRMIDEAGVKLWTVEDGAPVNMNSALDVFTVQARGLGGALHREQARQKTTIALTMKAKQGAVVGGRVFGYSNVRENGAVRREIHEPEAAIVRGICKRYADGAGLKQIARALNEQSAPSPRAQRGRRSGWSPSTVHAILRRPLYRGEIVWNTTEKRDKLGRRHKGKQKPRPESEWIRMPAPQLRIVPEALAAAVDHRLKRESDRYLRTPDGRLQGKPARNARYLLSGLARCATCGGGMEVFKRWSDKANVYGCATHRRKGPSICANSAVIEMGTADAAVLAVVEQALDPELLSAVVDRTAQKLAGQAHRRAQLEAECTSLEAEIRRLTAAIAAGGDLAPLVEALRERESRRQRVEQELKARSATFDRGKLRQALQRHAKDWRAMLRRRAENARAILRKFVAERFVFTPNPAGGYLFKGEGDLGLLLQMASPTGTNTSCDPKGVASPAGIDTAWGIKCRRILRAA